MSRNSNTAAMILALAGCVALATAAEARGGRGGGGGGSSGEGDFALRAELQNPRLAEPGSRTRYRDRRTAVIERSPAALS